MILLNICRPLAQCLICFSAHAFLVRRLNMFRLCDLCRSIVFCIIAHRRLRIHCMSSRHTVLDCMCGCVCGSIDAPVVAAPMFPARIPIVCNGTGFDNQDGNDTMFQIATWHRMLSLPSFSAAPGVSTGATERKCTPPRDYTVPVRYPYGTRTVPVTVPVRYPLAFIVFSRIY